MRDETRAPELLIYKAGNHFSTKHYAGVRRITFKSVTVMGKVIKMQRGERNGHERTRRET